MIECGPDMTEYMQVLFILIKNEIGKEENILFFINALAFRSEMLCNIPLK